MKLSETGKLLTIIAGFDNRKLDAEGTLAQMWHKLDFIARVDYEIAERAVVLFFSQLPPDNGQGLPFLDPRWLKHYIIKAKAEAETLEASRRARLTTEQRRALERAEESARIAKIDALTSEGHAVVNRAIEAIEMTDEQKAANIARLARIMRGEES